MIKSLFITFLVGVLAIGLIAVMLNSSAVDTNLSVNRFLKQMGVDRAEDSKMTLLKKRRLVVQRLREQFTIIKDREDKFLEDYRAMNDRQEEQSGVLDKTMNELLMNLFGEAPVDLKTALDGLVKIEEQKKTLANQNKAALANLQGDVVQMQNDLREALLESGENSFELQKSAVDQYAQLADKQKDLLMQIQNMEETYLNNRNRMDQDSRILIEHMDIASEANRQRTKERYEQLESQREMLLENRRQLQRNIQEQMESVNHDLDSMVDNLMERNERALEYVNEKSEYQKVFSENHLQDSLEARNIRERQRDIAENVERQKEMMMENRQAQEARQQNLNDLIESRSQNIKDRNNHY